MEKLKFIPIYKLNYQPNPYRCPVCGGNGLVPNGFYSSTSGQWSTTSTSPETCKSCSGKGYIFT